MSRPTPTSGHGMDGLDEPDAMPANPAAKTRHGGAGHPAPRHRTRERADAARNRARVLAAAERLFSTSRSDPVTMGEIAMEAGVGRATLYRRFPDPASIAVALLDEHERALRDRLVDGEPPLGPGAPPAERLAAFYAAMVDILERHLYLVLGAEAGTARFEAWSYGSWRAHVRGLLVDADAADPDATADSLLAPLAPEVYQHQRHRQGISQQRITQALERLARQALATR
ncbi:AcrR family transcriptional regulator [Actinoalloteichus hoggarensis]|nr:TetR/AcrR family transcriptional regulator [Actinoalloteichus hoggarensis]MBB5921269.1 AcrR family transcriptional regulator [Actinoalloteichus hoggarensis]